jgi:hypothetical protein
LGDRDETFRDGLTIYCCDIGGRFCAELADTVGWLNQRGSIMKLYAITPSGDFTGVYFNNAAGFQCRYGPNNPVP